VIDLYYWPTPNGWKITIFLEESGLEYRLEPVNIAKGEQFAAHFLRISPNNKIPAIVDAEGPDGEPISVFESGAILLYLAEKTGRFLPSDPRGRLEVLQWLMFQMGHVGPMFGQNHHFRLYAPSDQDVSYPRDRYQNETLRLYGVLDRRLQDREFVAGDYSIADMAVFPWTVPYKRQGVLMEDFPHLRRWFNQVKERPAVQRAIDVGKELRQQNLVADEKARDVLFGSQQYQRR
jgi:GST-like protein